MNDVDKVSVTSKRSKKRRMMLRWVWVLLTLGLSFIIILFVLELVGLRRNKLTHSRLSLVFSEG